MSTAAPTSVVYNTPEVNSGTTTSWIPVTTPWPSSSGCASSFFLYPGQPAPVAWDPGYGYFYGGTPRCLPPAATTWWEQNHQNGDGFTSLSIRPIVCPAAFTTAATSVQSGSSTLVVCCPSGYDLLGGEPGRAVGTCLSPLTSGQTLTYLASSNDGVITTTLAINSSSSIYAIQFNGWNVATASTTSSSSNGATTSQHSSGLSHGAQAGIGVSAAIGFIGILAFIGAFFLLRRRPQVVPYYVGPPAPNAAKHTAEPIHEMSAQPKPSELST